MQTCAVVVCDMKNTTKITCTGVISALAVVLMLGTNIPVMLYTVPAIAGILFMIPAIELGAGWAFLCYGVTAVLSLILPTDREALVFYIAILGYYPILKMLIERMGKKIPEYVIKFALFNIAVIAAYEFTVRLLGVEAIDSQMLGAAVAKALFLAAANVAFLIYDICLTRMIALYFVKLRKHVRKALGMKGKY